MIWDQYANPLSRCLIEILTNWESRKDTIFCIKFEWPTTDNLGISNLVHVVRVSESS